MFKGKIIGAAKKRVSLLDYWLFVNFRIIHFKFPIYVFFRLSFS